MIDADLRRQRRQVLRAAALCVLNPGVFLTAATAAEGGTGRRWGLLIDTRLCTASCRLCVGACNAENLLMGYGRPVTDPYWLRKVKITDRTTGHVNYIPLMCQHCGSAPCVEVCPTKATVKRHDGLVLIDRHHCIGCRYCMMACPYKVRGFVFREVQRRSAHTPRGKGTAEGCTLCSHRVDEGKKPACVEACSTQGPGAMLFGDLNDPTSDIARKVVTLASSALRPDLLTDPSVRYVGVSL